MKYFIEVSYLGTNFHGWQIQPNDLSIQGELEFALTKILGEKISIMGSSRTDTGVHARQQYAHFKTSKKLSELDALKNRLNGFLKSEIGVTRIFSMFPNDHTRFDALNRKYIYRIIKSKDPFKKDLATVYFKELDLEKLNEASKVLLNHIDFKSFSKVKTNVNTFECVIEEAFWTQNGNTLEFHIKANRFLRGMVRAIVGTLLNVGTGKITVEDFEKIILEKDRTKAGIAAKAEGLTLEEVNYPEGYFNRKIEVSEAEMNEMEIVKELFIKYQAHLGISLCFQGFQEELENLPGKYSEPTGTILLAKDGEKVVGIVALKQLEEEVCEMKRLFVLPDYQGYGIGKMLTESLLNKAKDLNFKIMKLDTLGRLESAVALYQKLGFEQTNPYNINPEEDILYFEKKL